MLESYKLDSELPGDAKTVISYADSSDVFAMSKKTKCRIAEQPINKPQPSTETTEIVHIKDNLLSLYPDHFTGSGKYQENTYHIQVDPSVPSIKTPCKPVPISQQVVF